MAFWKYITVWLKVYLYFIKLKSYILSRQQNKTKIVYLFLYNIKKAANSYDQKSKLAQVMI